MFNPENFDKIFKQAKQVQDEMRDLQDKTKLVEAWGDAGAGMVKILLNGHYQAKKVEIDADLMNEKKDILEDLVAAAINDASYKIDKKQQEIMSSIKNNFPPNL